MSNVTCMGETYSAYLTDNPKEACEPQQKGLAGLSLSWPVAQGIGDLQLIGLSKAFLHHCSCQEFQLQGSSIPVLVDDATLHASKKSNSKLTSEKHWHRAVALKVTKNKCRNIKMSSGDSPKCAEDAKNAKAIWGLTQ